MEEGSEGKRKLKKCWIVVEYEKRTLKTPRRKNKWRNVINSSTCIFQRLKSKNLLKINIKFKKKAQVARTAGRILIGMKFCCWNLLTASTSQNSALFSSLFCELGVLILRPRIIVLLFTMKLNDVLFCVYNRHAVFSFSFIFALENIRCLLVIWTFHF